jgi:hypothetical protein
MRPRRWILLCAALAALPDSAIGQTEPASATGSALFVSRQANEPRCGAYLRRARHDDRRAKSGMPRSTL